MLERMMDQQFMLYVLSGISLFVLLQKMIVSSFYRRLKKETEALPGGNGRWVKQLKQKYESTYKITGEIPNADFFVDRQVAKLKFFKIGLHGMETFYRKAQLICILLGGCSYIVASRAQRSVGECNAFFVLGLMAAIFLQLLANLSGNAGASALIRSGLTDYFGNTLAPKLAAEGSLEGIPAEDTKRNFTEDAGAAAGRFSTLYSGGVQRRKKEEAAAADVRRKLAGIAGNRLSKEEEERIVREVLKEFLT